jgi:hypothetical protein
MASRLAMSSFVGVAALPRAHGSAGSGSWLVFSRFLPSAQQQPQPQQQPQSTPRRPHDRGTRVVSRTRVHQLRHSLQPLRHHATHHTAPPIQHDQPAARSDRPPRSTPRRTPLCRHITGSRSTTAVAQRAQLQPRLCVVFPSTVAAASRCRRVCHPTSQCTARFVTHGGATLCRRRGGCCCHTATVAGERQFGHGR